MAEMSGITKKLQKEAHDKLLEYMVEHVRTIIELSAEFGMSAITLVHVLSEEKYTGVTLRTSLRVLKVLRERAATEDKLKAAANEIDQLEHDYTENKE